MHLTPAKLIKTVIVATHLAPRPEAVEAAVRTVALVRIVPQAGASFARRVRAYAAVGLLVAAAERHARREACAGCEFSQATGHRGLYRCTHRSCGCGGGDELRMAIPATRCERWGEATEKPKNKTG